MRGHDSCRRASTAVRSEGLSATSRVHRLAGLVLALSATWLSGAAAQPVRAREDWMVLARGGFVLPPELALYPWLIVTTDPFYWIALGL